MIDFQILMPLILTLMPLSQILIPLSQILMPRLSQLDLKALVNSSRRDRINRRTWHTELATWLPSEDNYETIHLPWRPILIMTTLRPNWMPAMMREYKRGYELWCENICEDISEMPWKKLGFGKAITPSLTEIQCSAQQYQNRLENCWNVTNKACDLTTNRSN